MLKMTKRSVSTVLQVSSVKLKRNNLRINSTWSDSLCFHHFLKMHLATRAWAASIKPDHLLVLHFAAFPLPGNRQSMHRLALNFSLCSSQLCYNKLFKILKISPLIYFIFFFFFCFRFTAWGAIYGTQGSFTVCGSKRQKTPTG